jgi:hypothetical protein
MNYESSGFSLSLLASVRARARAPRRRRTATAFSRGRRAREVPRLMARPACTLLDNRSESPRPWILRVENYVVIRERRERRRAVMTYRGVIYFVAL